mgnify:CR=1 FL=1
MAGPGKSLTDEASSCEIYDLEEAMRGVPYTNEAFHPCLTVFRCICCSAAVTRMS